MKLDPDGYLLWQKSLGGSEQDYGRAITQTYTGDYLISGYASSIDGDVTGKHGGPGSKDAWIIKLQGTCLLQPYYLDSDGDNYGDAAVSTNCCMPPPEFVSSSSDCNDDNTNIIRMQMNSSMELMMIVMLTLMKDGALQLIAVHLFPEY